MPNLITRTAAVPASLLSVLAWLKLSALPHASALGDTILALSLFCVLLGLCYGLIWVLSLFGAIQDRALVEDPSGIFWQGRLPSDVERQLDALLLTVGWTRKPLTLPNLLRWVALGICSPYAWLEERLKNAWRACTI